jgi:hypothetical protein
MDTNDVTTGTTGTTTDLELGEDGLYRTFRECGNTNVVLYVFPPEVALSLRTLKVLSGRYERKPGRAARSSILQVVSDLSVSELGKRDGYPIRVGVCPFKGVVEPVVLADDSSFHWTCPLCEGLHREMLS